METTSGHDAGQIQLEMALLLRMAENLPSFGSKPFWIGVIGMAVMGLKIEGFDRPQVESILRRSVLFYGGEPPPEVMEFDALDVDLEEKH